MNHYLLGKVNKSLSKKAWFHGVHAMRYFSSNPPTLLEGSDRAAKLEPFLAAGWKEVDDRNAIQKVYKFNDFVDAFSFMTRTAIVSEKMDHHPEWFNVYNTVDVTLSTHDCGGVSMNDCVLAGKMEKFASDVISN